MYWLWLVIVRPYQKKLSFFKELVFETGYNIAYFLAIVFIILDIPYVADSVGTYYSTYFPRSVRYYFVGIPMVVALMISLVLAEFLVLHSVVRTFVYWYVSMENYWLGAQTELRGDKLPEVKKAEEVKIVAELIE